MSNSTEFAGKVVIVSGSSSGIGEAIAIKFSSLGAQVVLHGRSISKLNKVSTACKQVSPNNLDPLEIVADITKDEECQSLIQNTIEQFGRIDVLVNNAGISRPCFLDSPNIVDALEEIFRTNVHAVLMLMSLAFPSLVKTKGSIVNISSCAGMRPIEGSVPYCSSKAALDMITRGGALEYGRKGVRVNSVNPGVVETPIFDTLGASQAQVKSFMKLAADTYPLGRIGKPEDIANAVTFLASEKASFIDGTLLNIDGGSLDVNTGHAPGARWDL